jgi:hypothetical protein
MKHNILLSESFVCACVIKIQIASGILNISIHSDITGEMWFGVDRDQSIKRGGK